MNYTFPLLMAFAAIYYSSKVVKSKMVQMRNTTKLVQEFKKSGINLESVDQINNMFRLFFVIVLVLSAVVWLNDGSGSYYIQSISGFCIVVLLIEIFYIDLKYKLYYGDNGFVYNGEYFKYKDVKLMSKESYFFRLGTIAFEDNRKISCFRDGIKILGEMVESKKMIKPFNPLVSEEVS